MGKARKADAGAKRSRKEGSVLDDLKPGEAQTVLHRLLAAHPGLGTEAVQIARSLLREVSFEAIADEVEDVARTLDLEDLNSRAGHHQWGYVEPEEAAWQLLEEAVEPFLEDMKRQIGLGLKAQALEICKGIVLGMYRVRKETNDGVLGWAPDFPAEAAADAVGSWRGGVAKREATKRGPRTPPEFPQDFVARFVPEWDSLIGRMLRRR